MEIESSTSAANRNWLAVAALMISLIGLLTIPIPIFPSCFLGWLGSLLGLIALQQVKHGRGDKSDRRLAMAALVIGFLPILAFCTSLGLLGYEAWLHWPLFHLLK